MNSEKEAFRKLQGILDLQRANHSRMDLLTSNMMAELGLNVIEIFNAGTRPVHTAHDDSDHDHYYYRNSQR
jgi:hypothetical protein